MQYRTFGHLDWKPSALGFGAMRLPLTNGDPAQIDEELATQMIRCSIDHGVNYVDTAYPYHKEQGEGLVGRALQDGYREKVKLATKMPSWLIETAEDFDRYLGIQLERLQTGHVDFYLIHALRDGSWTKLRDLGVLRWGEKAIADGRIGHFGFSFHDTYDVFKQIVDGYDGWTFCQIQYNYMDEEYQAGTKGLEYAAEKGLAVVIMEPIRGGALAKKVPPAVQRVWDSALVHRSPAEWALQWLWNKPEVSVVLSGMSTMGQVEENLASADRSGPGLLTEDELALVARAWDEWRELCAIPCTDCKYCLPCPSNVNIPWVFEVYNDLMMYDNEWQAQFLYTFIPEDARANWCTECGECLEKCPQEIEIPDWLAKAHDVLCKDD